MARGKRNPKSTILAELRKACNDETAAVEFIEKHRWGAEPVCPKCGAFNVYKMTGRDGEREANYRWRCRECKQRYTVRTGAIFEETRLPLSVWCFAMWKACSSKKGVSALQISRECEISYKSALFLMHRIRWAMAEGFDSKPPKLKGTVEVDETYVGGKPRYKGQSKRGRGTNKTPVVALVERGGNVRFKVMDRVTHAELGAAIRENVDENARLITDEFQAYAKALREHPGGHESVKHSAKEYVRPGTDVHSNTVEGVFSLLKRGLMGTFHSVSKHHLHRYLAEFAFRHNTRGADDGSRVAHLVRAAEGRRLQYAGS